jgi:hypothetical protein
MSRLVLGWVLAFTAMLALAEGLAQCTATGPAGTSHYVGK